MPATAPPATAPSSLLPAEVASAVANFERGLGDIEERVRRLQRAPWAELCGGLPPLESARLHLMVAYTINTLFYMYLKTQGIPSANHPVLAELERIKGYIRKVRAASQEAEASQRQASLNASAAKRFIVHALGGPSGSDASAGAGGGAPGGGEGGGDAAAPGGESGGGGSDGEYSRSVVERLDRERAGAGAAELDARLAALRSSATGGAVGTAAEGEDDALARELRAEVLSVAGAAKLAAREGAPPPEGGASGAAAAAAAPREGKGSKRRADSLASAAGKPKGISKGGKASKKAKKDAKAMGERPH